MGAKRLAECALVFVAAATAWAQSLSFDHANGEITITADGQPLATYVYRDEEIPRPYFKDLFTLDGKRVTRNHPPVEGEEPTDHATYHPGLWLAFGDISGADFWRNKATIRHVAFAEEPTVTNGRLSFVVENAFESQGDTVCKAYCRYTAEYTADGWMLFVDAVFFNEQQPFTFGDQEEMGLGVRVAAPLMVKNGGMILNSAGQRDEAGAWGKQAAWCAYAGQVDGRTVGVTLLTHPDNFRPSWFHARDYGLLLANPFGLAAFTDDDPSSVRIEPGEKLRLRFGVSVFAGVDASAASADAYARYIAAAE